MDNVKKHFEKEALHCTDRLDVLRQDREWYPQPRGKDNASGILKEGIASMSDPARTIFSITERDRKRRIGTAVAISGNLLVTCQHVVRDAKEVTLLSHHPVFEGVGFREKRTGKGKVIATDEKRDLAVLHGSSARLPLLELEDKDDLDDSTPLRVWSWPGWNKWEKVLAKPLEDALEEMDPDSAKLLDEELVRKVLEERKELEEKARADPAWWTSIPVPSPRAAVMTDSFTEDDLFGTGNNTSCFSFAGHIEGGMSGGPVVSVLTNKIVGIVTKSFFHAGRDQEAAEKWYLEAPPRVITAQLELGMGIAVSAKELKAFLDTKA